MEGVAGREQIRGGAARGEGWRGAEPAEETRRGLSPRIHQKRVARGAGSAEAPRSAADADPCRLRPRCAGPLLGARPPAPSPARRGAEFSAARAAPVGEPRRVALRGHPAGNAGARRLGGAAPQRDPLFREAAAGLLDGGPEPGAVRPRGIRRAVDARAVRPRRGAARVHGGPAAVRAARGLVRGGGAGDVPAALHALAGAAVGYAGGDADGGHAGLLPRWRARAAGPAAARAVPRALCGGGAGHPSEGADRLPDPRRGDVPLAAAARRVAPPAPPAPALRGRPLPAHRRALAPAGRAAARRLGAVLLHPRTLGAVHHRHPPSWGAVVVLWGGAARGALSLGWIPRPGRTVRSRRRLGAAAGEWGRLVLRPLGRLHRPLLLPLPLEAHPLHSARLPRAGRVGRRLAGPSLGGG